MTNSLIRLEELPLPDATVALTAADAERIATAIEAELAIDARDLRRWLATVGALVPGPGHHSAASLPGGACCLPG